MKTSTTTRHIAIGALCAAAAVFSRPAQAQTFTVTGESSYSQAISYDVNGQAVPDGTSGPYLATVNGVQNVPVFCVDADHNINVGQGSPNDMSQLATNAAASSLNSNGYYNGGLASAITATDYGATNLGTVSAQQRADEVAYLASTYINYTSFSYGSASDNFAAISVAIWDIVQTGGTGAYDTSQSFYMTSSSTDGPSGYTNLIAGYESQASTWYNNQIADGLSVTNSSVVWVQEPASDGSHLQEFLYVNPVPEPGVVVTTLSLVGMIGFGLVRGRRRAATAKLA